MKHCVRLILFLFFLNANSLLAQSVLPEFELKQIDKEKCLISWHNPFRNCTELFVQRSSDNKKFKTLKAAKNPSLYENSYTDLKSPKSKKYYYRIQYVLKGGKTYFTKSYSIAEKEALPKTTKTNTNWKASNFVFTNKNGFIQILLNNPTEHNYRLVFFDEKGNELFQMKQIESDNLILDNTNFLHGGWFNFELYMDNKLMDSNKVFLKTN
jgi:hypothetical protein